METSINERLAKPMPNDWKKIQRFCLVIGLVLTSITGSFTAIYPESKILIVLTAVAGTFTAVSTALSSLTVE